MALVKIPEYLTTSLWGWSWNKKVWPKQKEFENPKPMLKALEAAIMENPSAKHFHARAIYYIQIGDYEKALADYYQCVNEEKLNIKRFAERADTLLIVKDYEKALHDYELLVGKISEPSLCLKLTYLHLLAGNYFESDYFLNAYIEIHPHNSTSLLLKEYTEHIKRKSLNELKASIKLTEKNYTEENLLARAQIKAKVFDLVGAVEDYMLLYLLFGKEDYRQAAKRIKDQILKAHLRRRK